MGNNRIADKTNYCLECGKHVQFDGPMIIGADGKVLEYWPMHMHLKDYSPTEATQERKDNA